MMISNYELHLIELILDQLFFKGDALERIDVLKVFNLRVPVHWRIEERTLGHFLFSVISGGRGQLFMDDEEYKLGPGSVYLIAPGKEHSISTDPKSLLEIHSVHFSLGDIVVESNCIYRMLLWNETRQYLDALKNSSYANYLPLDRYHSYAVKNSVLQILLMFRGCLMNLPKGEHNFISRLNELDGAADLTVKELAGVCGYTEKAFIRSFKKLYGTTPHQYMIKNKILQAEYLLLYSDFSIKEIASNLGYKDQYIFSKQFKKQTGCSPKGYREQLS
ncbi:AraC family transcriptional regulator [Oceanispirochaeta crateris]|uniref:AraC family transcriptional regulator n=1 Tax=Oceanispirochaeta crateris TaxID=2518645 RepID=A0A5C1QNB6_9SPIO|nr:AraC family transcriptional regulator [Oceanispirochaeta crateris]QEN09443.1 AraC family transcriptional regulator [Oceanispirochaeta crateris]